MWTDRRRFLGLVGSGLAGLLWRSSASGERQPDWSLAIHRGTRNTPWRALRSGVTGWRAADRSKDYPGAPRHILPGWEGDDGPPLDEVALGYAPARAFAPEALSLAVLARLLSLTNGVTGGSSEHPLRAAPSAGALYAGEVYCVAERIAGLPRGLYYYAVEEGALVELRPGTVVAELNDAVERTALIENAAATLLLSNVFHRYAGRYGSRGYRYCVVDSGHIGENLRLAAAGLGVSDHSPLRFDDDRLHALLGIDGTKEAVCALHAIGKPRTAAPESAPKMRWLAPLPEPPGDPEDPEVYHRASKLMSAASGDSPPPGKGPLSPPSPKGPSQGAATGALPRRRVVPAVPLADAIVKRRSAERFLDEPLAPSDLGFALEMAAGYPSLKRAPDLELLVVVHRVTTLARGLYRYEPREAALTPLRQQDLRARLRQACMGQAKAASAAAAILMVGDFVPASRRAGARAYRDLLLEAGAMGQRLYLAAESLGIAARNLAAFWDDRLNELIGLDGRRRAVIHLTLLGPGN